MNLSDAQSLATDLMTEHGLTRLGWKFAFDHAKRRLGLCKYGPKTITLSRPLTEVNDISVIRNTILHEIAHALVGGVHGHDRVWKLKAQEIGAIPERCRHHDNVVMPDGRWKATCSNCRREYTRFRIPKSRAACSHCCNALSNGRFDQRFTLEWRKPNGQ